jgi:hypothetical protein
MAILHSSEFHPKENHMDRIFRLTKTASFHLSWLFMSPVKRYAYLWGKTRKLNDFGYTLRGIAAIPNK